MKHLTATGTLHGGQNAEGKGEAGKDREMPLQPVLCWHCCQRWEGSSYPNQLELTSSHKAAAHKTTFAQNGYITRFTTTAPQQALTVTEAARSASSPRRDTGRAAPPLLAGTLLREVVTSSNTTHCSNTLVKNILKGI